MELEKFAMACRGIWQTGA